MGALAIDLNRTDESVLPVWTTPVRDIATIPLLKTRKYYYGKVASGKGIRTHFGDKGSHRVRGKTVVDTFCGRVMWVWDESETLPLLTRSEYCRVCMITVAFEYMREELGDLAFHHDLPSRLIELTDRAQSECWTAEQLQTANRQLVDEFVARQKRLLSPPALEPSKKPKKHSVSLKKA